MTSKCLAAACLVYTMCVCLMLPPPTSGSKILISAMYGEGSHFMTGAAIGKTLARRGHDVSMLISNAYEHRREDKKYSDLSFEIFQHPVPPEEIREFFYNANSLVFKKGDVDVFGMLNALYQRNVDDCEAVVTDKKLMQRLEEYEAIIVDITWPCARFIQAVLEDKMHSHRRRSMISLSATAPWVGYLRIAGSATNYAYQPEIATGLTNRMTFKERIFNVIQSLLIPVVGGQTAGKLYRELASKLDLGPDIDPYFDMADYDLHLINIGFGSDFPAPLTPNIIAVGALTAKPHAPLSKELEDFMQSSGEDGVVVFTLGTYLASITTFRPEIVEMFAEAFAKLPQKVLWQLKELPDWELPPNVKTMPWLPQNDLLGHPKTRVLMWQGGNNGFQEACYHGVPAVVIPLQGDQYDIAARVEARGLGKKIDKSDLGADIIYRTLTEVISNPSYTKVAKQVSAIYHDQPMSAPDRAAFWIEHVIKFGGSYMRSPANDLNFIQYHLIDVYAFLTAIVVFILAVVYYILRFCLSICCRVLGRGGSTKSKTD